MRRIVLMAVVLVGLVGCHRRRVEYEYEKPVTVVSGGTEVDDPFAPPPPTAAQAAPPTTVAPVAPPSVWRRGEKQ